MFVQSSHFIEQTGAETSHQVSFYGQEFKTSNLRLAKMNLAVHGLEGDIREANTYYEDVHNLYRKCDFVMANPPFNVDRVDAEKVRDDRWLQFGLPGVNKDKKVAKFRLSVGSKRGLPLWDSNIAWEQFAWNGGEICSFGNK